MQRSNMVTHSLAVLTLAALALPASAQFPGGYRAINSNPVRVQSGYSFPYFGWNTPPLFFGNNGGVYVPPSTELYVPSQDYYQPSDAEVTANNTNAANVLPRTSDAIQVERDRTRVTFTWQGEPNAVRRITFALLDRAKQPIRQQVLTRLPAEARLNRNGRTAYYQVVVEYLNGTTNNVIAPL